jgi:hypothetical protein
MALLSSFRLDILRRKLWRGEAHFFAIPHLATPAGALRINDAGACSTAAFVILH